MKLFALAVLLFALATGLYLRLLSTYAIGLGASGLAVGLLNATMLSVIMISNAPGAWAVRRFRLKPVIVAVWWLGALAPVCFYLAPSWPWLVPGYVFSGLSFANSPAIKSYAHLKSEPAHAVSNFATLFAAFPLGLTIAPLIGGFIAEEWGMRTVFLISIGMFILSAAAISLIHDTPYHSADTPWSLASLWRKPRFRRYVAFFLAGFFAVYVGQDFMNPYLAQVHDQGFFALGVYSSLAALGTTVLTVVMGRVTDLRGPRAGVGGVLAFLLAGCLLLLLGTNQLTWGLAALALGAFDALRYVAYGIVGPSFKGVPLAWGYAVFDIAMGLPMVLGAVLGGLMYRFAFSLPFMAIGIIAAFLLILLLVTGKTVDEEPVNAAG